MKSRTTTTPPDLDALYQQLLSQLGGGVVEVDTPQLGRVGFARPAELYAAMNYLRMAQAAASGTAVTGVIVIGHDRGLWPCKGCCTDEELYQPGDNITVTAPTGGVTAGQLVIVKALVGVASTTQPAGAQVEIATEGVYDLAKNAPDVFNPGDVAKVAAGSNTVAVAGTLGIGWVTQAAAAGAATVRVKLTPCVASPPTLLATETPAAQNRKSA